MSSINKHIERARKAKRESKYIEFKESFDINSMAEWCEILKDIVAIANTGGGIIIIGIQDNGKKANTDIQPILNYDSAKITDKVNKYTGTQFADFEVTELKRRNFKTAAIIIDAVYPPMIFTKPGTYNTPEGQHKKAFSQGTIYFRHGAKSEPATSADLEVIMEREIKRRKKVWLGNIRKLIGAPSDHQVHVLPPNVKVTTEETVSPVRITTDASAPVVQLTTPDDIYKYRRTEVVDVINKKLKGHKINTYDIQAVGFVYNVYANENLTYLPSYSSPQYSDAFVDWIVDKFKKDKDFFDKARQEYYDRFIKKE